MANSPIREVCLIAKRSLYDRLTRGISRAMVSAHRRHESAVKLVQEALKDLDVPFKTLVKPEARAFGKADLVITVGGDGTFLRTAHEAGDKLLFPVNSDPARSVGALCTTDARGFTAKMRALVAGDYGIRRLPLMEIAVAGKRIPVLAVNDALFTNVSPAATSRYELRCGGLREEQRSSGVWIAAATGSTAAIGGAGGQKMLPDDARLQFAVREPYRGNFNPYRLVHGYVEKGRGLSLVSRMIRARVYVDGPATRAELGYGDAVTFRVSAKTLAVVA